MINFALIRQKYTPFGGAERIVENTLESFSESKELSLNIICTDWQSNNLNQKIKLWQIKSPLLSLGRSTRNFFFAVLACRKIKSGTFNIIQSHEKIPCCDIYRAGDGIHKEWLKQRRNSRSTIQRILDSVSPFHRLQIYLEKKTFESSKLKTTIAISNMVKKEILLHYPQIKAKIEVIYNGVDLNKFRNVNAEEKENIKKSIGFDPAQNIILFCGSGYERKGLETAIYAMVESAPNHRLVVIGKDRKQRKFQLMAKKLGVEGKIIFLGGQKNVIPFYQSADVLVHPAIYEPFGNVILEGMACGLPVICSNKCGGAELIDDPRLVIYPRAVAGLTNAIKYALANKELGIIARRKAEEFTNERMRKKMIGIYNQLLSN